MEKQQQLFDNILKLKLQNMTISIFWYGCESWTDSSPWELNLALKNEMLAVTHKHFID